jgi:hypothetical protein
VVCLKKTIGLIIIAFGLVLIFTVLIRDSNIKNIDLLYSSLDDGASQLIQEMLDYQYGYLNEIDSQNFSEEFGEEFYTSGIFDLAKYAPYKIINVSIVEFGDKITDEIKKISLHMEDDNGSYHQIIMLKKVGVNYQIIDIDFDI